MRLAVTAALLAFSAAVVQAAPTVQLEQMTSSEVHDALRAGTRTVIIPVGGTEQNGAHMTLGKHNHRVAALAARIAAELGHTLVAPVVAYVPEGRVAPPEGHMRYAGTISVPEAAFKAVLDGAARSLAQHGFTEIVLLGDSGNYQRALAEVAQALNRGWKGGPARAHHIAAYYDAAQAPYLALLRAQGLSDAQIGHHAGAADTALMLAVDPAQVRSGTMRSPTPGVSGDPARASAELGRLGTELIVRQTVAAIRAAIAAPR
jgi:creatinine amidohydrolase/Fe(II)-dependent formamide hydrolase-like protein